MERHPFRPGQANGAMTRNKWGCCDKPAADHPEWRAGESATVRLKVDVTTFGQTGQTFPKGTVLQVERDTYEVFYVIDGWARDKAEEYTVVEMPGWHWSTGERTSVSIPWHQAKEV